MGEPFHFYSEYNLPLLLGIKAKNVHELLDNIKSVPDASIYYHTHRFLHQHRFLIPEPPNDFAYWVRNVLNLRELGEVIASINIAALKSIRELRNKLAKTLDNYDKKDVYAINCIQGNEFQFMSCRTFCLSLENCAKDLREFAEQLEHITLNTFYFHIFEVQLRFGRSRNDFSNWFESLGYTELANKVAKLDPYTTTLEGLREDILNLVKQYDSNK